MKLASNPKEKRLLIGLSITLAAALLYLGQQFIVAPIQTRARKVKDDRRQTEELISKGKQTLQVESAWREQQKRLQAEKEQVLRQWLLRPQLASYLVSAQSILIPMAQASGFTGITFREIGTRPIPRKIEPPPKPVAKTKGKPTAKSATTPAPVKETPPYQLYAVELYGFADFAGIVHLVRQLETSNPYVTISELSIRGQPDEPLRHKVTVRVEWPIEAEMPAGGGATTQAPGRNS
jgi:hypothetical protein